MAVLDQIASKIIKEQELVIGPLAWTEAKKVQGMQIDIAKQEALLVDGDPRAAVDRLVAQYERLFGRASREVCREAVSSMLSQLPPAEIPSSLVV
jgi:hypothetical protein